MTNNPTKFGWLRGVLRALALAALGGLLLLPMLSVVALYFDVRMPWLRLPLAAGYALAVLAVWLFVKRRLSECRNHKLLTKPLIQ